MNRAVYRHILATYGRHPVIWFGLISEAIRTLVVRVWLPLIVARLAADLVASNSADARHQAYFFLGAYLVGTALAAVGDIIAPLMENNVYVKLNIEFYAKLTGKDMAFYRDNHAGYLVSLYRQYLDSVLNLVRLLRNEITRMVVSLIAPVVVLLALNFKLGLIIFVVTILQIAYIVWASSQVNVYRQLSHEIYRKATGEVADEITNITAFKASGASAHARETVAKLAKEEARAFWLRRKFSVILDMPREVVTAVGLTGALLVIISGTASHAISVSLIVLTLTYLLQVIRTVSDVPGLMILHDDLVTKAYPTLAYLGTDYETIRDPARPQRLEVTAGAIELDHVSFSYPSRTGAAGSVTVFDNLSLNIRGGERLGIVGLSGAGKSTLASLLMRFDEVTGGAIRIDGTDIRDVRQNELRTTIAYVPQEPLLFHRSIKDNIAYFNGKATMEDIMAAAKAAHAHEFIEELPGGYDSMVGERGVKLSGGQKQRVVIARSILKNAPIMLFDEATSALDSESEKIIQDALPHIIGRHTAIVIAHRLSTVAGLDRILVMDRGVVAEEGTHEELLALDGRYASLWRKQTVSE